MDKQVYKLDFRGRNIKVEIGELAKQSNGSVLVRYGDTVVLSVAVLNKEVISNNLYPLPLCIMNDYIQWENTWWFY